MTKHDDDDALPTTPTHPPRVDAATLAQTDAAAWVDPFDPRDAILAKVKGKAGRKPTLTPKVREGIARGIARGLPNKWAAALVGVAERTFYQWIKRGNDPEETDGRYAQFVRAVQEARAAFIAVHVGQVVKSSLLGDTANSRWLLANADPESFGAASRTTIAEVPDANDGGYRDIAIEDLRELENRGKQAAQQTREELQAGGPRANPLEEE